jgi:aryl-alcohol dehydrogenase-like predicted oxidoreductase/enamine deaminase RidA (YjgF/YER057c/UK114 family)
MTAQLPRTLLAPGLDVSRIVTGLWQVADMERDGTALDLEKGAAALADYAEAGFDTFDMADHYGSAELLAGRFRAGWSASKRPPVLMTKWVPEPGPMTADVVRRGVEERLTRLGVSTIDVLQFHWWTFEHPGYLDALTELARLRQEGLIRHIGLTNFDTDHLRLVVSHGIPIASNQVSFSLIDRRAAEAMSAFCLKSGVRLLAYGTLCGGFLSERWLGAPEPARVGDWSKMKYGRFIGEAGGWPVLQRLLAALKRVADRHQASIANVATRWVLDHPAVAATIVGARLSERQHRDDNLRMFSFALDARDHSEIATALEGSRPIPGDCGDEYRKPPFLTASGDLSHHLASFPKVFRAAPVPGRANRWRVDTGSVWEPIAGYSRAMRAGERVLVSGTTATHGSGTVVAPGDVASQTVFILDRIKASLAALGATLEDIVRTRVYLKDQSRWEEASRVHGRYLGAIRPANTLVQAGDLIGDYEVEIEAEAMVDPGTVPEIG